MSDLTVEMNNLKKKYREIFLKSGDEIQHQIDKLKPENPCKDCSTPDCGIKNDIFENFPKHCQYKTWQKNVLNLLDNEVSKGIYDKWMKIIEYRSNFKCVGCATCCKLACSEFSYEELKHKASEGDNFAKQFTNIFVPYEDENVAREIYPEYFKLLADTLDGEKVYFYHCPKLTADDRCSDYGNRPSICRDFPENPLSLLPAACGFCQWKDEVEPTALMLHSMLEIVDFYKNKIPHNCETK